MALDLGNSISALDLGNSKNSLDLGDSKQALDLGESISSPEQKGFFETLRNPIDLMFNLSLIHI